MENNSQKKFFTDKNYLFFFQNFNFLTIIFIAFSSIFLLDFCIPPKEINTSVLNKNIKIRKEGKPGHQTYTYIIRTIDSNIYEVEREFYKKINEDDSVFIIESRIFKSIKSINNTNTHNYILREIILIFILPLLVFILSIFCLLKVNDNLHKIFIYINTVLSIILILKILIINILKWY